MSKIAIVGMGGVYPSAPNPDLFWEILRTGQDTAREVPEGRWPVSPHALLDPKGPQPDRVYGLKACLIDNSSLEPLSFDEEPELGALFNRLDPLFSLGLRAARQAWCDAKMEKLDRSRVGVILGNIALPTDAASKMAEEILGTAFEAKLLENGVRPRLASEPLNRYVAGLPALLIARALRLAGPAFTLDAACASSLYALKLACDALRDHRVDAVLSGGLSRPDSLYTQMGFSQLKALATSGKSTPFDAAASGLVVGEGAGVFVLKRLEDALNHGDRILGIIAGVGLSNDLVGNLLAPSSEGQLRAMRAAYAESGWQPWDLDSIECHATGTPLGDAVEFESLCALWADAPTEARTCVLGSVKANIGHLLTGAGAASLMKGLLSLRHGYLTPTANFEKPATKIALSDSRFRILRQGQAWPSGELPRRFGVSAFGFGGINAHLLVEEWKPESEFAPTSSKKVKQEPVALVGLAVRIGGEADQEHQKRILLGMVAQPEPVLPNWWGLESVVGASTQGRWSADGSAGAPLGQFIRECKVPLGKFRIPPNELEEMLPQQLLALETASAALVDAGVSTSEPNTRAGVFLGIGLDLNTTNFQLRWTLERKIEAWAARFALDQEQERQSWLQELRQSLGPALNANRTIGALGGMVASRLAREFRMGGPSFTLSSEETSGIAALQAAARAVAVGELDLALAGAVDFCADPRMLLGQTRAYACEGRSGAWDERSKGATAADGAVVLVLKRLADAERDGDRIYAVLEEAVQAQCAGAREAELFARLLEQQARDGNLCRSDWMELALEGDPQADRKVIAGLQQWMDANEAKKVPPECAAEAEPFRDHDLRKTAWLGAVAADVGHCGAASALLAVARAALALHHRILPPHRLLESNGEAEQLALANATLAESIPIRVQHWLRNASDGPRRALCFGRGVGGDQSCVRLSEYEGALGFSPLTPETNYGVFCLEASQPKELLKALEAFAVWLEKRTENLAILSSLFAKNSPWNGSLALSLSFCSKEREQLNSGIQIALDWVTDLVSRNADALQEAFHPEQHPGMKEELRTGRQFFHQRVEDWRERVAFVFPGSGSHYPDMGRELALQFPGVFLEQARLSPSIADQLRPDLFWKGKPASTFHNLHALLLSTQVALGAAVADVGQALGLEAKAMIGYSLGESTMMFASRAWSAREEMFRSTQSSDLFRQHLAGPCLAARKVWELAENEPVDWVIGVVNRPAEKVKAALQGRSRAYLLIINTHKECVIGGQRSQVEATVAQLGCVFFPLQGVVTVHCPVLAPVAERYRAHHVFPSQPPEAVRYYGGAHLGAFEPRTQVIADEIHDQAFYGIDFPRAIEAAYADGMRVFIEMGPGASCARMIHRILRGKPHYTRSLCFPGDFQQTLAQTCAALATYGLVSPLMLVEAQKGSACSAAAIQARQTLDAPHAPDNAQKKLWRQVLVGGLPFNPPKPPQKRIPISTPPPETNQQSLSQPTASSIEPTPIPLPVPNPQSAQPMPELEQLLAIQAAGAKAHGQYLQFAQNALESYGQGLALESDLLQMLAQGNRELPQQVLQPPFVRPEFSNGQVDREAAVPALSATRRTHDLASAQAIARRVSRQEPKIPMFFNRAQCLTFAVGKLGDLLPNLREADHYPTRVRLPDEPLMLCDRILIAEGEAMKQGRCVTEHDVLEGAWYLDCGRIPTCIAVEAGQADLFLSGFLGIDLETKGLACYRLLDAVVTFHDELPRPGQVIRYDIRINQFFRQGRSWFFKFQYDGTLDGKALITMRDGCAGFFDEQELEAGRGIFRSRIQRKAGGLSPDWRPLLPTHAPESYDEQAIDSLRQGRLDLCFGGPFRKLPLRQPLGLPGELLTLVHRVLTLDPSGGDYGIGFIRAEADIHPDDWFLTSHFVDDRVMPGTLMYECCMHTLRILLLRLGWVGESGSVVCQPVPGVASVLKCRGQVLESTKVVRYEVTIKELGYRPEPYVICDALMYSDQKCIVEIGNMSLRMSGLTRQGLEALWASARGQDQPASAQTRVPQTHALAPPIDANGLCGGFPALPASAKPALYDRDRVLAYAIGKPSDAFGERYRCFDHERIIARLPGPPFMFLDRLVKVDAPAWILEQGGVIEGQYQIPGDAWYFAVNQSGKMPFVVLLEIALQPCGWFAAYMGSALTSQTDLKFRNLGGKAVQYREVGPDSGLLAIDVRVTKISSSGGMILQNFDYLVRDSSGPLYVGDTYFGFFSQAALANQVGIREAKPWTMDEVDRERAQAFDYPQGPGFPLSKLRMIDRIDALLLEGGPHGCGYVEGSKAVDPGAWFFEAHFYQDPVIPGSLGLESFVQLLKVYAAARWQLDGQAVSWQTPVLGKPHEWIYRGQVIPSNKMVRVTAEITQVDDDARQLKANGYLQADGKTIYQIKDFCLGC